MVWCTQHWRRLVRQHILLYDGEHAYEQTWNLCADHAIQTTRHFLQPMIQNLQRAATYAEQLCWGIVVRPEF